MHTKILKISLETFINKIIEIIIIIIATNKTNCHSHTQQTDKFSVIFKNINIDVLVSVGNVFWLPIRQNKFLGTIEFLVSIYGKILVILSSKLDISYRSLDSNIFKFAAPLCLGKSLL